MKQTRILVIVGAIMSVCACASISDAREYAAFGSLNPALDGQSQLIGVFSNLEECEAAADAWASQQVVGNPIVANCVQR